MFLLANFREQLLPFLPKNAHIAEVGVNMADLSRKILDQCAPAKLHLIDPWELSGADDDYAANIGHEARTENAEERYEHVVKTVGPEMEAGVVKIHRAYSHDAIDNFEDESLDWVYIDANHQYEYVKKDLEMFLPKLKPDGLILGHDYANNEMSRKYGFGVVEAVNEFCSEQNLDFMCLTFDPFPTYVLAKDPASAKAQQFLANVLYHLTPAIRIENFSAKKYQQVVVDFGGGTHRTIISVD
ncbi:methyltransferase family protein [Aestuariispira insulae]|uniref:Methyltransferase family protein n=2 Tax=Aestuariispira insulae TaxID=1461337 RepID=A0A3D9HE42_9PROT|nr:methyltransferase family protein [Aestuariispira insulae]